MQLRFQLLFAAIAAHAVLFSTGRCSCINLDNSHSDSNQCYEILQSLQEALYQDKGNLHQLRKAFFYAPNADPVLLRVKYNITFAENITKEMLPYCISWEHAILLNHTEITVGWTSRGLYRWIEPLLLNRMQMALPFTILRVIHRLGYIESNPEMESFLWDGSYNLPTILINLHITSLPCIPSNEGLNSNVEDLTTFLNVYAFREFQCVSDSFLTEYIGFSLNGKSVSSSARLYISIITWTSLYFYDIIGYIVVIFVYTAYNWAVTKKLATPMSYHDSFLLSAVIIGSILMIFEFGATLQYIKNTSIFLLSVWVFILCQYLVNVIMLVRSKKLGTKFVILHFITFLLPIYHLALPTFLLLVVYPMKVIAIFSYLITAIFVAIIICCTYVTVIKQVYINLLKRKTATFCNKTVLFISLLIAVILILATVIVGFVVIFQLVYGLILEQSSGTSRALHSIITLIPTAAISFISWSLKTKVFRFDFTKRQQNVGDASEQRDIPSGTDNLNADTEEHVPLLRVDSEIGDPGSTDSEPDRSTSQDCGVTKNEDK